MYGYSDEYRKLYIIDDKSVAMSAGQNTFGDEGKSFTDVMSEIDFSGLNLEQKTISVYEKFKPFTSPIMNLDIGIFEIVDGTPKYTLMNASKSKDDIRIYMHPQNHAFARIKCGEGWMSDIINEINIQSPIHFLTEVFRIAYDISQLGNKTIGGPVHMLKLSTKGIEWIMGEYCK